MKTICYQLMGVSGFVWFVNKIDVGVAGDLIIIAVIIATIFSTIDILLYMRREHEGRKTTD